MRHLCNPRLLAVAALIGLAGIAHADFNLQRRIVGVRVGPGGVEVRAPFVRVYTGPPGTEVIAPFVRIQTPGRLPGPVMPPASEPIPVQPPADVPLKIVPPAPPVPLPGDPPAPEKRVSASPSTQTIYDFTAGFKPAAGRHDIVVVHPYTNALVKVSFVLPEGTPTVRVKGVVRRAIEFHYGGKDVAIWFYRDGRVSVNN